MKFKNLTVQKLRRSGYKVRVYHDRSPKTIYKTNGYKQIVTEAKGSTTVAITLPNEPLMTFEETAYCSDNDQFNKRIGVHVCIGRIFKKNNLPLPTETLNITTKKKENDLTFEYICV